MSIGSRVRDVRKELKMSQQRLGELAGLKQATISELETGESASSTQLASIATALGVSAYWLETGKGLRDAPQTISASPGSLTTDEIADLVRLYGKLTQPERVSVIATIRGILGARGSI